MPFSAEEVFPVVISAKLSSSSARDRDLAQTLGQAQAQKKRGFVRSPAILQPNLIP